MKTNAMRPKDVFGRGKPIPVGHTKFYQDFVLRDPSDPFIPGTSIPRLRLAKIGPRSSIAFEDEVYALVEALRAMRDAERADVVTA